MKSNGPLESRIKKGPISKLESKIGPLKFESTEVSFNFLVESYHERIFSHVKKGGTSIRTKNLI